MARRPRRQASRPSSSEVFGVDRPIANAAIGLFVVILCLGGSSFASSGWSFILSMTCVPFLVWALLKRPNIEGLANEPLLAVVGIGWLALVILHLLPIPFELWSELPAPPTARSGPDLLETGGGWRPLSWDPSATLLTGLSILPPVALALLLLSARAFPIVPLGVAFVCYAAISALLGLLQALGSTEAPLYLHPFANRGLATGFFSNANHFGSMLLTAMPVLAALLRWKMPEVHRAGARMFLVLAYAGIALVGVALGQTIAGYILLVPTLAASLLLAAGGGPRWARLGALALPVLAVAGLLGGAYLSKTDALEQSVTSEPAGRIAMAQTTLQAAESFWPVGSGLGTFTKIYPLFERPEDLTVSYANRAHNEYLEVALEAGLPGILLMASFFLWWLLKTARVWRFQNNKDWAMAGSVVIGILLAHSIVDYPVRTPAMASVFLIAVLLLAGAAGSARGPGRPVHLSL